MNTVAGALAGAGVKKVKDARAGGSSAPLRLKLVAPILAAIGPRSNRRTGLCYVESRGVMRR